MIFPVVIRPERARRQVKIGPKSDRYENFGPIFPPGRETLPLLYQKRQAQSETSAAKTAGNRSGAERAIYFKKQLTVHFLFSLPTACATPRTRRTLLQREWVSRKK